jgi:4-hydroxybenzoate polyprenyltransferase
MSDSNSSNVASVAIVLIVVVAAIAFYFLFGRGINNERDIKIDVDVPDKIEVPAK